MCITPLLGHTNYWKYFHLIAQQNWKDDKYLTAHFIIILLIVGGIPVHPWTLMSAFFSVGI